MDSWRKGDGRISGVGMKNYMDQVHIWYSGQLRWPLRSGKHSKTSWLSYHYLCKTIFLLFLLHMYVFLRY